MDRTRSRAGDGAARLDRLLDAMDGDLVVASNRQPYRHEYEGGHDDGDDITVDRPAGGLTAGLDAVMRRVEGTWVAWGDGDADPTVVDGDDRVAVPPDADETYALRRLWLTDDEVENYYYRISNQVLWPLCHAALGNVEPCGDAWTDYRRVNDEFAEAVATAADDAIVWLQDYHLTLAPRMVRERTTGDPFLAHSWHVPWPAWDTFRACPHREAVVRGLLGNDLLTFHVPRYCENFLRTADRALPDATVDGETGEIAYRGETTVVRAVPMGVPTDRIRRQAGGMEATGFREAFRRNRGIDRDVSLAVGVDRLDYTKGIPERLAALEQFFAERPERREGLTYVQVGTESRSSIPAYADYQEKVGDAVERINERFATDDWRPVVYTTEMISDEGLAGLYREADLAIVSPIRDGMNLVAQEYVAAHLGDDPGTLVLSDQAGVHDELGEWAVSVRPHDTAGFADAVDEALTMPDAERRRRFDRLADYVRENDIESWMESVLATAASARDGAEISVDVGN